MEEHLANVAHVAIAGLEQFKKSGTDLSNAFMKHFVTESNRRFKETCDRYPIEAKLKILSSTMTPKQKTNKHDQKNSSTDTNVIKEKKKKNSTVVNEPSQKLTDSKSGKTTKRQNDSTDGTQHLKKKRKSTKTPQNNTSANANNKRDHESTNSNAIQTQNLSTSQTQPIPTASNAPAVTPPTQTRPVTRSTVAINLPIPIIDLDDQQQAAVIPSSQFQSSSRTQSPSQTGSAVTIRRPEHITDLIEQRKLSKDVYIAGISRDLDIKDLYGIFLLFCQKLGISMAREEIEGIYQCIDGITVKFYQLQTKEWFVSQTNDFQVCINELVYLPEPIAMAPWAVYVQED